MTLASGGGGRSMFPLVVHQPASPSIWPAVQSLRRGVRRVRQESISSQLIMCGGGVRSIVLLPLVARCLETIDVCIWRMFVFMSVVVIVWGSVGMFVV